jgi:predicted esterase
MRLLILSWILSLTLFSFGNQITRVPKSTTNAFGVVVVKNNNFKAGQPCVIFLAGIGERGTGSYTDLGKIAGWGGIQPLYKATDLFNYNVVAPQTAINYQAGEIKHAVEYAIKVLGADPNRIYAINNSNGGYGFAAASGTSIEIPKMFAAVAQVVMGPGEKSTTAQNIVSANTPVWFFSAADDTNVVHNGVKLNLVSKTDTLYARCKRLGGKVWYTRWKTGGHGVIFKTVNAYNTDPNKWVPSTCATATIDCAPIVSIYQWFLNNKRGQAIKSPYVAYATTTPVPPVDTTPTPTPTIDVNADVKKAIAKADTVKTDSIAFNLSAYGTKVTSISVKPQSAPANGWGHVFKDTVINGSKYRWYRSLVNGNHKFAFNVKFSNGDSAIVIKPVVVQGDPVISKLVEYVPHAVGSDVTLDISGMASKPISVEVVHIKMLNNDYHYTHYPSNATRGTRRVYHNLSAGSWRVEFRILHSNGIKRNYHKFILVK